jgi:hypothetical protein
MVGAWQEQKAKSERYKRTIPVLPEDKNHQTNPILSSHLQRLSTQPNYYHPLLQPNTATMHFTTVTFASILALTSSALAGQAAIKNNCPQDIFLTITRQDQTSTQQKLAAKGGYYSEKLQGQGNSYGLTKDSNYYSANTAKLIWGASDSAGVVYYSLNNVDGNAFAGQSVKLTGNQPNCAAVTTVDGSTKACSDSNDFTLTLC